MRFFLALTVVFFVSCHLKNEAIQQITVTELHILLQEENIQLLDVRTQAETDQGYIENAVFADVKKDDFYNNAINVLDKNKPVYVYCRSGRRSQKACEILQAKRYNVYNVQGGYITYRSLK